MTPTERVMIGIAKALVYAISILTAAIVLFRYTLGFLWGSGSDLGMIAAPFVGALGVLGLTYLIIFADRDVRRHFKKD